MYIIWHVRGTGVNGKQKHGCKISIQHVREQRGCLGKSIKRDLEANLNCVFPQSVKGRGVSGARDEKVP